MPSLAVATVEGGQVTATAVVGRRRIDDTEKTVEPSDRFHIGSVTKSVTATMIGSLVEKGVLSWDLKLGDALEDFDMWPEYADCTLLQLLQHRAGIRPDLLLDGNQIQRFLGYPGSPTEQRAAYLREVLGAEPGSAGAYDYSNAGYTLAGFIAEQATGKSWAELIREHVFEPLDLEHSDVGWPATAGAVRATTRALPPGRRQLPDAGARRVPARPLHGAGG